MVLESTQEIGTQDEPEDRERILGRRGPRGVALRLGERTLRELDASGKILPSLGEPQQCV
jgi:hypothetical protein